MYTTFQEVLKWGHEDDKVLECRRVSHHSRGDSFSQHVPSWNSVLDAVLGVGRWEKMWVRKPTISAQHSSGCEPNGLGVERQE